MVCSTSSNNTAQIMNSFLMEKRIKDVNEAEVRVNEPIYVYYAELARVEETFHIDSQGGGRKLVH